MWLKRDWTNSCRDERESFSDECESSNRINANSLEREKTSFPVFRVSLGSQNSTTLHYMLCAFVKGYKLRMRAARFAFTLFLSLFSISLSGALLPLTRRQTLLFLIKVHHFQLPKGASLDLKWSPPKDRTDDPAMESPTPLESVQRTRSLNI